MKEFQKEENFGPKTILKGKSRKYSVQETWTLSDRGMDLQWMVPLLYPTQLWCWRNRSFLQSGLWEPRGKGRNATLSGKRYVLIRAVRGRCEAKASAQRGACPRGGGYMDTWSQSRDLRPCKDPGSWWSKEWALAGEAEGGGGAPAVTGKRNPVMSGEAGTRML